jgi:hypothetical protein
MPGVADKHLRCLVCAEPERRRVAPDEVPQVQRDAHRSVTPHDADGRVLIADRICIFVPHACRMRAASARTWLTRR